MSIEVRRDADRFVTREAGRTTYHCFSYGAHYDPANVGFGPVVALNDEQLPSGTGYAEHPHAHVGILTWVLSGTLAHRDSLGHDELLPAGSVAWTCAGSGLVHAEQAGPDGVRFLQVMLRLDDPEATPSRRVGTTGRHDLSADVAGVVADLGAPGPFSGRLFVFVVDGVLGVGAERLEPGDSARISGTADLVVEEPGRALSLAFS